MNPGSESKAEMVVSAADCAPAMGSGSLSVLATPRMIALMEQAACAAVEAALQPGQTTVGVHLDVEHMAATPIGARVTASAVLDRVEGRTLHLTLSAEDERETIGRGSHRRVVVDAARFMEKVQGKRK